MRGVFLSLKIGGSFDPNFLLGAVLGILEPGLGPKACFARQEGGLYLFWVCAFVRDRRTGV